MKNRKALSKSKFVRQSKLEDAIQSDADNAFFDEAETDDIVTDNATTTDVSGPHLVMVYKWSETPPPGHEIPNVWQGIMLNRTAA